MNQMNTAGRREIKQHRTRLKWREKDEDE